MPNFNHVIETEYKPTFRTEKVVGMFDVPATDKLRKEWQINMPIEEKDWQIGLIVGALNINKKNTTEFLVSVIALLAVGSLGALAVGQLIEVVGYLEAILGNFIVFVAAAALVVSIKAIIVTSKK